MKTSKAYSLIKENLKVNIPPKNPLKISIIIPVHNEVQIIKRNLEHVIKNVEQLFVEYQILIVEDGSSDGSEVVIKQLTQNNPRITFLHSDARLGKGQALKNGIKIAKEKIIVFMDADLTTQLKHLAPLAQMIQKGFTMAIGSRAIKGSQVKRPLIRKIVSKIYNILVKILFNDEIHDHQCGFKALNRDLILPIINEIKDNEFFFDTELIIKTKKKGHTVIEIPVKWEEPKGRTPKFQLIQDGINILIKLLKMRINC